MGSLAGCFDESAPEFDAGTLDVGPLPALDSMAPEGSSPDSAPPPLEAGPPPDAATDGDATIDAPPTGAFPVSLDFGLVDCGSPTATKTYSFTNTGPVAITYSASIAAGSAFAIQGTSSGTVVPGAMASITLAITVPASSTAGTAIADTLTLTTDVPGYTSVAVALKVTPQGGSFTVSPAPAAFAPTQLSTQAPDIPLTVTNVGNAPVSLAFGTPSDAQFAVAYTGAPAAATVAPGATLAGAVARFRPSSAAPSMATAALQATGAMCASAATAVSMTGSGTAAPVTVSPNPADFGTVACGSTGTAVPLTIANGYGFAVHYTAALGQGGASPFSLDATSTGTVPANGHATIQVTPKAVAVPSSTAPGAIKDTLTVTTDAPGGAPIPVALTETASGAILAVSMPTTGFGGVAANGSHSLPFTVTNSGSVDAPLTVMATGAGFGAALTGTATAKAGNGQAPGNATFSPTAIGSANGSLTVSTTAVLCAAPPPAVTLTASGTSPMASPSTQSVAFTGSSAVSCGGQASAVQSITITNNGDAPLLLSSVQSQNNYFNVVSYTTSSIGPGQTGGIDLQVPAPTQNASGVYSVPGGTYTDALLFTTNELGSPTHSVAVTVEIVGANLSWVDANGNALAQPLVLTACLSTENVQYGVANTGNTNVYVTAPQDDRYPSEPNERFGGAFSTAQLVAAGASPVLDTVGHVAQNCTTGDTLTFTVSGPVGNVVVPPIVCVPLPSLRIGANVPVVEGCPYCC